MINEGNIVPAWTFSTRGLFQVGNKEIIATLKCQSSEIADAFKTKGRNFPESILHLIADIFDDHFGAQGEGRIDEAMWYECVEREGSQSTKFSNGSVWAGCIFGPPDYMAYSDLEGVFQEKRPYLCLQPLFKDELMVVKKFGSMRVFSLLGLSHKYYPCPHWIDRDRKSSIPSGVPSEKLLQNRVFESCEQVLLSDLSAVFDIEKKSIFVKIPTRQILLLQSMLLELPQNNGIIFNLTFSSEADSHLYWNPSKEKSNEYSFLSTNNNNRLNFGQDDQYSSKSNRQINLLGGSFLAFVPRGSADLITIHEDGFIAMISPVSWSTLQQCLSSGINFKIASDTSPGLELDITFFDDDLDVANEESNEGISEESPNLSNQASSSGL